MAANPPVNPPDDPFEVRSTEGKGMGTFATRDIKAGEQVLLERCCLKRQDYSDFTQRSLDLIDNFEQLSQDDQERVMDLYSWAEPEETQELLEWLGQTREDGTAPAPERVERHVRLLLIFRSNNFKHHESKTRPDGSFIPGRSGLYLKASRINHSCDPNLQWSTQWAPGYWKARAVRDIKAGSELTIAYMPISYSREKRQQRLKEYWGFVCRCDRCEGANLELDIQLQEALQTSLDVSSQEDSGHIPPFQDESEQTRALHDRRVQQLEELGWLPQLFFAYSNASEYYRYLYNLTVEDDVETALEYLTESLQLRELAYDAGVKVWRKGDQMVVDTGYEIQELRNFFEQRQSAGGS